MKKFFECLQCKKMFSLAEAKKETTSYEKYYGVRDLFSFSYSDITTFSCPHCGSDRLEELYLFECSNCGEVAHSYYEFYGNTICFDCALEYLPETELILKDFIEEDYPQLIKLFKELTRPLKFNLFEVVKTLSKESKFFFQDYLYYLEELYNNFPLGKDVDDTAYFTMCYDCVRSMYCHEECTYCDDYLEYLEKLEAIEVVLNKYPFLRKEV